MKYLTNTNSIDILPLSTRLYNGLRRNHINTIGELLKYHNSNGFVGLPNLGNKSVEELNALIIKILSDNDDEYQLVKEEEFAIIYQSLSFAEKLENTSIQNLPISDKAKEFLHGCKFINAAQLYGATEESIQKASKIHVPQVILQEIIRFTQNVLIEDHSEFSDKSSEVKIALMSLKEGMDPVIKDMAKEISSHLEISEIDILAILFEGNKLYSKESTEFVAYLYNSDVLCKAIKQRILEMGETSDRRLFISNVMDALPVSLRNSQLLNKLLFKMEKDGTIIIDRDEIIRVYPSAKDVFDTVANDKQKDIIHRRISGQTLEEIGREYSLTRERVRQIIVNFIEKVRKMQSNGQLPKQFDEDKYAYIFEKYDLSFEDFQIAFNEPISTYYYLDMITKGPRRKEPLESSLEDISISIHMRRQLERAVYKHYITVDGVRVKKQRPELVRHYIKTWCKEITDFDEFLEGYRRWIDDIGLSTAEYQVDSATYKNKLNTADYVLWNQWSRFRYYDIEARDFENLLSCLDLDGYQNVEMSTLKWFKDYPEIMKEYDIRDEYELHNLLKKILQDKAIPITFAKMPTVIIGNADRDEQVLELLLMYAPIDAAEFAQKYEEQYGVKATTVLANYLQNFDDFYFNGVYSIDGENLPFEQFQRMQEILTEDYYLISNIKKIYLKEFKDADPNQINPYTLKTLGFRVYVGYAGYVIKNKYANALAYFQHILTSSDVIDGNEFDSSLYYNAVFNGTLLQLRASGQIVDFAPKQYISANKLTEMGITPARMNDFCRAVSYFVDKDTFFTIKSIKQDGFENTMFSEYDFDDWFYGSLLCTADEHFTSERMGKIRVFYSGKKDFTFSDFLYSLVKPRNKIAIVDLMELLITRYGMSVPKDKVLDMIRNETDMYYDSITATVFINYDIYEKYEKE